MPDALTIVAAAGAGAAAGHVAHRLVASWRPADTETPWSPPPAVLEATGAALSAAAVWFLSGPAIAAVLTAIWTMLAAVPLDLKWKKIPDQLTYPAAAGALATIVVAAALSADWTRGATTAAMMAATPAVLLLIPSLGGGDIKWSPTLAAPVAWLFGWPGLLLALFVAMLSGSVLGGLHALMNRNRQVPFGPHLAVGALTMLAAGGPLLEVITGWLGLP